MSKAKRVEGFRQAKEGVKALIKNKPNTTKKTNRGNTNSVLPNTTTIVEDTGEKKLNRLKAIKDVVVGGAKMLFNHNEWYEHYPLNGLVGANFARRKGIYESGVSTAGDMYAIPSATRLCVNLTTPNTQSDSYQQAMNILFNRIRRANAGAVNYTPGNLENYVRSIDDLRSAFFVMRRAYAALKNYSSYDATVPAALFAAMGLDYETFRIQSANLREYMAIFNLELREFAPLNIDIFRRHEWMFSNIFADSDDVKASYYVFSLQEIHAFDYTTTPISMVDLDVATSSDAVQGGITATVTGLDYATFISRVDAARAAFKSNAIFQIIAGDILKAYGQNALFNMYDWDINTSAPIVYDEKALTQIQNIICAGEENVIHTTEIIDTNGMSKTTIKWDRSAMSGTIQPMSWFNGYAKTPFVNMYKNDISSADLISATRFKVVLNPSVTTWASGAGNGLSDFTWGTEIVAKVIPIYRSQNSPRYGHLSVSYLGFCEGIGSSATPTNNYYCWAAIDYAPATIYLSEALQESLGFLFDFNNYARIDYDQASTYHSIACLSLYYAESQIRDQKLVKLG